MLYTSDSAAEVMDRIPAGSRPEVGVAHDVRGERQGEVSAARYLAALVVPATACSGLHAAARLCRPLLRTSLLPLDAVPHVESRFDLHPAEVPQQAVDCVRSVQDRSLGARHHRLLSHGYGVLGVWGVPQEVCGVVFRDAAAAGHRTRRSVPSFADVQVLDYITP